MKTKIEYWTCDTCGVRMEKCWEELILIREGSRPDRKTYDLCSDCWDTMKATMDKSVAAKNRE